MNSGEHTGIGIIVFLLYAYFIGHIVSSLNNQWIWGLIAVVIGSLLPDILEPARNYRHRALLHSVRALLASFFLFGATALIAVVIAFFSEFSAFYLASCFFLGYMFHLLADSITPMGLPR
jgi:inner membrane protein